MFQFKKFSLNDDDCAMKVGTDAILLGAWVHIHNKQSKVLDVGTGSGIIALMLAQRFDWIHIDAIEIDEKASLQCKENFKNSKWNNRLNSIHIAFQEHIKTIQNSKVDVVISNPPFFETHQQIGEQARNLARNNISLPLEVLLKGSKSILQKDGHIALIIPYRDVELLIDLAKKHQLFLQKICHVKGIAHASFKRSLVVLGFENTVEKEETLDLKHSNNEFTEPYKNLVKDFYLHM